MALRKTTPRTSTRAKAALKTVQTNGATVDIATSAKSAERVTVLFASRRSQKFLLPNGHVVFLASNAVHLAGQKDGVLPEGGYSVNFVDKADWAEVKKVYGKAYKPWFDSGKIVERSGSMSENAAVALAADNAGDDCDDNPIKPGELKNVTQIKD
jgi:hypothetical protein